MPDATPKAAYCLLCKKNNARIRGLCNRCYQMARRAGDIDMYPNQDFLDHSAKYAEWMVEYKLDELEEFLAGQGLVLITGKEYALLKNF